MKLAALIVGVVIAASLLWLAGEQHRENCIREDRTGCSMLPWESGKAKDSLDDAIDEALD